jgi:hypothetical protein
VLSSLLLLAAGISAVACNPAVAGIPDVAGIPAIAGVHLVRNVLIAAFCCC